MPVVVIHGAYEGNDIPFQADGSTGSLIITQYDHHELHEGNHYFIEDVSDLPLNNVFDMQWVTADNVTYDNFVFELNCESETEWFIYEGATIITPGTIHTPVNNHRNSPNTAQSVIREILNTSIGNANADTAVAGATELAHGIIGAGKSGGIITRDRELILKRNTTYCMRAIANAAGYVNFYVEWYEHADRY